MVKENKKETYEEKMRHGAWMKSRVKRKEMLNKFLAPGNMEMTELFHNLVFAEKSKGLWGTEDE